MSFPTVSGCSVRAMLSAGSELALIDVRPEPIFARGHPLWAASMPLGSLEIEAWEHLPRHETPIVVMDDNDGLANTGASRLERIGFRNIRLLEGGLGGWISSGGEVFTDVNVPSKAFGELVASVCQTPSLPPEEVAGLIESGADMVVVDVRRYDEYHTMNIPGSINVPGAELVHRIGTVAHEPSTLIVVNCAGRTRSIIGTQSLRNAAIPNRVVALRNGTIGWSLAGLELDHGRTTVAHRPARSDQMCWADAARTIALGTGVCFVAPCEGSSLQTPNRTAYFFDIRDTEEFENGHPESFIPVPGGQLLQETDRFAPVRGALLIIAGDGTARAPMTASWLAQMGWEVVVIDDLIEWSGRRGILRTGAYQPVRPTPPRVPTITVDELVSVDHATVIDVASSRDHAQGHIPGAYWEMSERLGDLVAELKVAAPIVVTSADGVAAAFAVAEIFHSDNRVRALLGGTAAWHRAGMTMEKGRDRVPETPPDVYRRPYEGTSVEPSVMQAYLDWEYGLVEQLARDGTHGFTVWQGESQSHPDDMN